VAALPPVGDALDPAQTGALLRKWLARLPHPSGPVGRAILCPAAIDDLTQPAGIAAGCRPWL